MSFWRRFISILVGEVVGKTPDAVDADLDKRAQSAGQRLNWRTSIVDLLKLIGHDNSMAARKALAIKLGYSGEYTGTASDNMWLHAKVIQEIAHGRM